MTNFWSGTEPLQFPKQITFDFSREKSGIILGFVCEHPNKDEVFEKLKRTVQEFLKTEPKLEVPGFIAWRDEIARRSVTLALDESKKNVQLIVVSIDKSVRGTDCGLYPDQSRLK